MRVEATPDARTVIRQVAASGKRDLVMTLGTGCCDSTAPFLYDRYLPGSDAVEVGRVDEVPVFAHRWLADLYGEGGNLVIDVSRGEPNDSFSLESDLDCRFVLRIGPPTNPG